MGTLGDIWIDQKEPELAEKPLTESARLLALALGPSHRELSTAHSGLAKLRAQQGNWAEAESHSVESVKIAIVSTGLGSPHTRGVFQEAAVLCEEASNADWASELASKLVDLAERLSGQNADFVDWARRWFRNISPDRSG